MRASLTVPILLATLVLPCCEDRSAKAATSTNPDPAGQNHQPDFESSLGIDWPEEVPVSDRIVIENAIKNGNELTGELDELLKAVNAGESRQEIEKKFGQPDQVEDNVAIYRDDRFDIPIYSGLSGLSSVRIRYTPNGIASYDGASWNGGAPP